MTLWLLSFAPTITYAGDSANYIAMAYGLITQHDIVAIQVVGEPQLNYQPLLSLLVSPVVAIAPHFPNNLPILVMVAGLFIGAISLWLLWRYLNRTEVGLLLRPVERLWVLALFGANYILMPYFTRYVMTEALYLVTSLAAILALYRYRQSERNADFWLIVTAFFLAASYYTRAVGVTLIAASAGYLLVSTRRIGKTVWLGGATMLFLLPWMIRNRTLESSMLGGRYSDLLMRESYWSAADERIDSIWLLAPRAIQNTYIHMVDSLPQLVTPWLRHPALLNSEWGPMATSLSILVGLLFFGLILLGYIVSLRHSLDVVHLYLLLYVAMIVITPWITVRNWVPVLPFLLTWILIGSTQLGSWLYGRWPRAIFSRSSVVLFVALTILLSNLVRDIGHIQRGAEFRTQGVPWTATEQALDVASTWLQTHTEPDELVFHIQPQLLYLYSGRQTTPVLASNDPIQISTLEPDVVMQELYDNFAYVLRDSSKDLIPGLDAAVDARDQRLQVVYETGGEPNITIFRITPEAEQ